MSRVGAIGLRLISCSPLRVAEFGKKHKSISPRRRKISTPCSERESSSDSELILTTRGVYAGLYSAAKIVPTDMDKSKKRNRNSLLLFIWKCKGDLYGRFAVDRSAGNSGRGPCRHTLDKADSLSLKVRINETDNREIVETAIGLH